MSEDEKIRAVIEKYQKYLEAGDADVARTAKGVWFFLIHDPEEESYYKFFCFTTADELERGIVETASDELNCLLEIAVESCTDKMEDTEPGRMSAENCGRALAELAKNIQILGEGCRRILPRIMKIAESLSRLSD